MSRRLVPTMPVAPTTRAMDWGGGRELGFEEEDESRVFRAAPIAPAHHQLMMIDQLMDLVLCGRFGNFGGM